MFHFSFPFSSLINACSKIGDVDRAFAMYTRMRERGDTFEGDALVHLFNVCHRCGNRALGLEWANQLWKDLQEDDFHFISENKGRSVRILYNLFMTVLVRNRETHRVFEVSMKSRRTSTKRQTTIQEL